MLHVLAFIKVKKGCMERFSSIFKNNVPVVRAEIGCVEYSPAIDFQTGLPIQDTDPDVFTVVEKWSSYEDWQAHMAAPHMKAYKEDVADIVESVTIKILQDA